MFDWTCGSFLVDISCMCYIMYYICFNLFFILKHFTWTCLRWVVVSNMESLILKSSWENKLKWWTQISKHQVYQAGGVGQSTTWFDGRTSPTLRDSTKKTCILCIQKKAIFGSWFLHFLWQHVLKFLSMRQVYPQQARSEAWIEFKWRAHWVGHGNTKHMSQRVAQLSIFCDERAITCDEHHTSWLNSPVNPKTIISLIHIVAFNQMV